MRWLPAAPLAAHRRAMALFTGAELVLVMAIPFLAIAGYYALLDSKAGTIIEAPGRSDPGWMALVDPSPVAAVIEVDNDQITGITLLVGHQPVSTATATTTGEPGEAGPGTSDKPLLRSELAGGLPPQGPTETPASGGAVILVPGTLVVDGETLGSRSPAEAADALSRVLRLGFTSVDVADAERWASVLGDKSYELSNPDPITGPDGGVVLPVGSASIGSADAPVFLGRTTAGSDSLTLLYRRRLFWTEVIADPPTGPDPLADRIAALTGPSARVVDLPLDGVGAPPSLDMAAAEEVIQAVVPVPAGAVPSDRVQVRVLDRTGGIDLEAVAADVASTGAEVVAIGNAGVFDDGPTELVVPPGTQDPVLLDLASLTGATTVEASGIEPDPVVTLLVGTDANTGLAAGRSKRAD